MKLWETFIRRTFGRYLTDEVLEELLNDSNGLRIGGERREVTILISDIRQSTELSEKMDPVSFFRMLNHYFEEMIEIINAWRGNILDFVGDSIVAVFGAPKPNELSARDATACAVAMQRRMKAVNEWNLSQEYPEISMGIGIHTGEAILGNIGSMTRAKYDMIGRDVNRLPVSRALQKAARFWSQTRPWPPQAAWSWKTKPEPYS